MSSIVVTAIGMASSLGPSTCACAASRAGLSRPQAAPYRIAVSEEDARDQVTVYPCKGLAEERIVERLPRLLAKAAVDLAQSAALEDAPPRWLLNASGHAPDTLAKAVPSDWVDGEPEISQRGHAGALALLAEATELLAKDCKRCVVGGVDSYIEHGTLAQLDATRVLKTPVNGDGFIPGEGAALLLLERREEAEARGAAMLAELGPVVVGEADYSFSDEEFVPTGAAWARAIAETLDRNPLKAEQIGNLVHDYNGWSRRGREFAMALMRARRAFSELEDAQRSTPAECFGDVGAANAAIALCTSVTAHARGYARKRESLVIAASDDGARAAAVLRSGVV